MLEGMLEGEVYMEIYVMAERVIKVKAFLMAVILCRRYRKLKKSTVKIQRAYKKHYKSKREKQEAIIKRDSTYITLLDSQILRIKPRDLLNQAATKI
jgi:hypothetical protein